MTKAMLCAAMLLVPIASMAAPANAEDSDFVKCDGLKAPGRNSSGMNDPAKGGALLPSRMNGSAIPQITACTAALANERLLPKQAPRRINLLRARALAYLADKRPEKAIADVDAAEAAEGDLANDRFFNRSIGVSLELVKAFALQAEGKVREAHELACAAADERPYSDEIQSLAAPLMQRTRDFASNEPGSYVNLERILPGAILLQLQAEIETGHFDRAARLRQGIAFAYPTLPPMDSVYLLDASPELHLLLSLMGAALNEAYAYAALGKVAQARPLLSSAVEQLSQVQGAFDAAPGPTSPTRQAITDQVGEMTMLIEARIAVVESRPTDALKAIAGKSIPANAMGVDLLHALRATLPAAQLPLAPDPTPLEAEIAQRRSKSFDPDMLFHRLPELETSRAFAKYKESSGIRHDGFRSGLDGQTGVTLVEFIGTWNSASSVAEMALLRAADLAREQGKSGFVVVARRDLQQTLTEQYLGMPEISTPMGFRTQLYVLFVDPKHLPATILPEQVLDADTVYTNLAQIYVPQR